MWDEKSKYPLCWPDGWPRTNPAMRYRSRFGTHTIAQAFSILIHEGSLMGAKNFFLSSNVPRTKSTGAPVSSYKQPTDTGVAVYFGMNNKPVSLACDKWNRVEDNMWALAKHIEALRGQERWGVGTLEQAFRGYMALPGIGQTSGSNWWDTLGIAINASPEQAREAFRLLAKKHHPDVGGDAELFRRITEAYEQFERLKKAA